VIAAGTWWALRPAAPSGLQRLAVLPFENLGATEDDYFADGITDEVRGKLAAIPGLHVTARSSAIEYKKTTKKPAEIGRELGVDYLLTGTVRWQNASGAGGVRSRARESRADQGVGRYRGMGTALRYGNARRFQCAGGHRLAVAKALDVALGAGARAHNSKRNRRRMRRRTTRSCAGRSSRRT
jgi:hypothetical protein